MLLCEFAIIKKYMSIKSINNALIIYFWNIEIY